MYLTIKSGSLDQYSLDVETKKSLTGIQVKMAHWSINLYSVFHLDFVKQLGSWYSCWLIQCQPRQH